MIENLYVYLLFHLYLCINCQGRCDEYAQKYLALRIYRKGLVSVGREAIT